MTRVRFENMDDGKLSASTLSLLSRQKKRKNWFLACFMLITVVMLVTVSSQLSNLAFTDKSLKFNAPFLFLIIKVSFRIFTFPVYLLITNCTRRIRGRPTDLRETVKHCTNVFGSAGWSWKNLALYFFPSSLTVLFLQIGWILGLAHLTTSIATAIFCSAVAISYIFTCCCLEQPFLFIKGFFVAVAFAGVGLIVYGDMAEVVTQSSIIGVVATCVAAVADALHLLAFKKAFPELDLGQTSFVVSVMFLLNCIVLWPVPLILELLHYEFFDVKKMPVLILLGAWICSSLSSMAAGYGLVVSNPFFMSISELLLLATNSGIDVLMRGVKIHAAQIAGTVLIGIAFLILVLPDDFVAQVECSVRRCRSTRAHVPAVDLLVTEPSATDTEEDKIKKPKDPDDGHLRPTAVPRTDSALNVHGLESYIASAK